MIGNPKTADRLVMALAVAAGFASMGLFAWAGRPTLVPLGWTPGAALAWDAGLSRLIPQAGGRGQSSGVRAL